MKAYQDNVLRQDFTLSLGRNLLPYTSSDRFGSFSYIHPLAYLHAIETMKTEAIVLGFNGIMLDRAGYTLYSSFSNHVYSRGEAKESIANLLIGQGVISGFDFTFQSSIYTHVTLDHSLHMKFSDTIPFLSYVLAPYKELYSKPFNLYASSRQDILRLLDFHIMPNYMVTHESAIKLLNTPSNVFFSTQFSIWKDTLTTHYLEIEDIMNRTRGLILDQREILEPGVVKITYVNGDILYINYLNSDKTYGTLTLESLHAKFIGGNP